MSEMQDMTPQGRADDAVFARMLGKDRAEVGESTRPDAMSATAARMCNGGCGSGSCGTAHDEDKSVCGFGVDGGILASVYAPIQCFDGVYDVQTAMRRGTMFEALDKPFYGDGKEVNCRGREG